MKKERGMAPFWVQAVFFLILWGVLLRVQNPGLMSDDSGEMISAAANLGIAHPPGYPLFCLLGRLVSFLPVGTVAFRFNLLSSLFTLLSLGFLLAACRSVPFWGPGEAGRKGRRVEEALAFWAVLVCFSDRSVLAQSLTGKGCVYTLTLLGASFLLWLYLRFRGRSGFSIFLLGAFAWASGMANHWQTQILWLPFLVLWARQEKMVWSLKSAAVGLSGILLGLSVYLYMPLRTRMHPDVCWGDPLHWKGFYWVLSRRPFAGLEPVLRTAEVYEKFIGRYLSATAWDWVPLFFIPAIAGFFQAWKRDRGLFYGLAAFYLPVVTGIISVPRPETLFLVNVYLVSTASLWALAGFLGARWLAEKIYGGSGVGAAAFLLLLVLGSAGWLFHAGRLEDKSRYLLAGDFGTNALKALPRNALLLADGDQYVMPILYGKYVLNQRPDVVFEPAVFLYHDWGWRELVRQSDDYAPVIRPATLPGRLRFLEEEAHRHPFFYSLGRGDLSPALERTAGVWVPDGLVSEWSPRLPVPGRLEDRLETVVSGERWRGLDEWRDSPRLDLSSGEIYRYYARQFYEAAQLFSGERREGAALAYFERGLGVHPEAFAYNDTAVILGRMGYPEMARRLCAMGLQEDPGYLPAYLNMAECFRMEGNPEGARQCYRKAEKAAGPSSEWSVRLKKAEEESSDTGKDAVVQRSPADYKVLSAGFGKQGLPLLSSIAASTAVGMRNGAGR